MTCKTLRNSLIFTVCLLSFGLMSNGYAETTPAALNDAKSASLAPMLKATTPTIVNIAATGTVPFKSNPLSNTPNPRQGVPGAPQGDGKFESLGSGVIVDAHHGYIITNAHVVRDSKIITVTLKDGRRYPAKIIGSDPASDIAIIQIKAHNLTAIHFANSNQVKVGDFVAAIGSPFGLTQSVTSGIVSALARSGLGIEGYEDFIQTDAPINPGNSGGALVNLRGNLVGINTAILAPDGTNVGIGFAIPSNMAHNIMEQLIKYGKIHRGLMGVLVQNLSPALADAFGVPDAKGALVTMINPSTPASKSGLQVGDIITAVNGEPMSSAAQVRNTVGLMRIGSAVHLSVLRDGKKLKIKSGIADPQVIQNYMDNDGGLLAGMSLRNFDEMMPVHGRVEGVQIMKLKQNSPGYRNGLRPGDIILTVDRKPVKNLQQFEKLAHSHKNQLLLNVMQGGGSVFLVVS